MHIKIASIMLIASVLGLSAIIPAAYAQTQAEQAIEAIAGGFETITIQQSEDQIIITITKEGGVAPPVDNSTGNVTIPDGPIIIVPPNNGTGQNGTVIVPPLENQTMNITEPQEPPVVVIDPEGNNTVVNPPSNVTVVDNNTVVVAPPDQNVTTTPGNVTVIDPPVQNVTEPATPGNATEPCTCPPAAGVVGGAPDIQFPNATISNDTTIVRPDTEPGEESGNGNGNGEDNNGGG